MEETQQQTDKASDPAAPPVEERRLELPTWVAAAIGLTLVGLAAMAVYTGFRTQVRPSDRGDAVSSPFDVDGLYPEDSGGPPGSPEPGDSRVSQEGDVPAPGTQSTAVTEGTGPAAGEPVDFAVRRGLVFTVDPPDAVIYVNEVAVGSARQFRTADDAYEFAEEGVFSVRISSAGYEEAGFRVSAGPEGADEVTEISLRLRPAR